MKPASARPGPQPSRAESYAAAVQDELTCQDRAWERGSTRRTFLAGLGMVGVAALGSQLVTARAAYAATSPTTTNTLVAISLRGGVDGLRMLIPASAELGLNDLLAVRPDLVPGASDRIALPGGRGWAINNRLAALAPYWSTGELAFVPAVLSPGATRSHFESFRNLQAGSPEPTTTGWLDRLLNLLGPGTTFRAMGMGEATAPASYLGAERDLVLSSLQSFSVPGAAGKQTSTLAAIQGMYRGFSGDLPSDVAEIARAFSTVSTLRAGAGARNGARYPIGAFGRALADVATVLHGEVGMQVCTLDVGGWDTHSVEAQGLDGQLASLASALDAFMTDLGPARRSRVTILVQTEFGRHVAQNGNLGTDHGLGSVIMMLGGGLRGSGVYGKWAGLAPAVLDHGDVPGTNHPFDVMAEIAAKRLDVTVAKTLFPGHTYKPLGLARA